MDFAIYYTLGAVAIYFIAAWAVNRIEQMRGKRFAYRNFIFFIILFGLAMLLMSAINPSPDQNQQIEEQPESTQAP